MGEKAKKSLDWSILISLIANFVIELIKQLSL